MAVDRDLDDLRIEAAEAADDGDTVETAGGKGLTPVGESKPSRADQVQAVAS